ncbi:MAG: hypothetical protein HY717_14900 [Planctomycetes bacterium]|nr:hypothetical protein [Planctomycetota bacterium]
MELLYCSICGSICPNDSKQPGHKANGPFVCPVCQKGGQGKPGDAPPSQAPAGQKPGRLEEAGESLELFSPKTIALNRQKAREIEEALASQEKEKGKEGQLSLLDPLDLFSDRTIALKKKKHFGISPQDSPELTAEEYSGEGDEELQFLSKDPDAGGSESPARSAKRILFNCLYCHSKLMVRPVQKVSKLVCPRCSKPMYIDPSSQISKEVPKSGSFRREGSPGSSRVKKEGPAISTVVSQLGAPELSDIVKETQELQRPQKAAGSQPSSGAGGEVSGGPSKPSPSLEAPALESLPDQARTASEPARSAPEAEEFPSLGRAPLGSPPPKPSLDPSDAALLQQMEVANTATAVLDRVSSELAAAPVNPAPAKPPAAPAISIGSVDRPRPELGSYGRAALFSLIVAAPLFVAAYFVAEERSINSPPPAWTEAAKPYMRTLGEAVEKGVDRLRSQLER